MLGADDGARRRPARTMASGGAPRKDRRVPEVGEGLEHAGLAGAVRPRDHGRPLRLGFERAAAGRCGSRSARADGRSPRPRTRSGDPHRHQEVAELVVFGATHRRGPGGVRRLDDHLVTGDRLDAVDEVRGVERDDQILAGVVTVDRLGRVTDVLALHAEVHAALAHGEPDGRRVVAHEELDPAQRGEEALLAQVETVRIVVGDQLLVVRVAPLEQPRADLHVALPEGDLVAAGRHADPLRLRSLRDRAGRQSLQLGQRTGRHQEILLAEDGVRSRQVAHGHAVRVGRHHAQRPVDPRHQDTGQAAAGRRRAMLRARPGAPLRRAPSRRVASSARSSCPTGGNSTTGIRVKFERRPGRGDRDVNRRRRQRSPRPARAAARCRSTDAPE